LRREQVEVGVLLVDVLDVQLRVQADYAVQRNVFSIVASSGAKTGSDADGSADLSVVLFKFLNVSHFLVSSAYRPTWLVGLQCLVLIHLTHQAACMPLRDRGSSCSCDNGLILSDVSLGEPLVALGVEVSSALCVLINASKLVVPEAVDERTTHVPARVHMFPAVGVTIPTVTDRIPVVALLLAETGSLSPELSDDLLLLPGSRLLENILHRR